LDLTGKPHKHMLSAGDNVCRKLYTMIVSMKALIILFLDLYVNSKKR